MILRKRTMMKLKLINILLVLLFWGCHKSSSNLRSVNRPGITKENDASKTENISLAPNRRIYMKNCDQIVRTMAKLTGVSSQDPSVQNIISETKGACPASSDPEAFDAPQIVAYQKLALEFCGGYVREIVLKDKLDGLNAKLPPNEALTPSATNALYSDFYTRLWMGPRAGIPSSEALKASLDPLIEELKRSAGNTAAATQSIIQGSCAAVLSSSPVISL